MTRVTTLDALVQEEALERSLRLVILLNLMDALYTQAWVHWGWATEANPVMAGAMDMGPSVFILSKVALVSLSVWVLWNNRDQLMARLSVIPLAALYAFVGGHHLGFAGLLLFS